MCVCARACLCDFMFAFFLFFFANSFCVRTRTAENAIRGSHELEHTHAKHALAEEIGEKEGGPDKRWPGCHRLLQGWRDVSLAARRVKTRQSCVPKALFVPDDSQLMSYLGQSTLRIECVHRGKKREVGRGRGDKIIKKHQLSGLWYNRCSRFVAELQAFASVSLNIKV